MEVSSEGGMSKFNVDGEGNAATVTPPAVDDVGTAEELVVQSWWRRVPVPGKENESYFHVDFNVKLDRFKDENIKLIRGVADFSYSNDKYCFHVIKGLLFNWDQITGKIVKELDEHRRKYYPEDYSKPIVEKVVEASPTVGAGVTNEVSKPLESKKRWLF